MVAKNRTNLATMRKQIDRLDNELVIVLKKRIQLGKKILSFKRRNNMPKTDTKREKEIISRLKRRFNNKIIQSIYHKIFDEVKKG